MCMFYSCIFWCFYCVRVAVFSSLFVIRLLAIVRGVSVLCGCATASSYSLYTCNYESRGISYAKQLLAKQPHGHQSSSAMQTSWI